MPLYSLLLLFCGLSTVTKASKIEKGFSALLVHDYFTARKLFYEVNEKRADPFASYGLAAIFIRNNNPFYDPDSAAKYVNISYHTFLVKRLPLTVSGMTIDSTTIIQLADSVTFKNMLRAKKRNTVAACNEFLHNNYLGKKRYIYEIVYLRDELEFNHIMETYISDTTRQFIITHPQSIFLKEATILLDRQLFDENTKAGAAETYISFIKKQPKNIMVNTAYEKLFAIYKQQKNVKGLREFVLSYPKAPQSLEAWKLLFSLTVKTYSYNELKKFIDDYPGFPLKSTILKELELNKLALQPVSKGDLVGFADEDGKFIIRPMFDEATEFSEGLAVVAKGDSVYFINKENQNPFNRLFTEAFGFKNGIAPVKQSGKWIFINRQGQVISKTYDEIAEMSDNMYVIKTGEKYGAVDQYGQVLIDPQFEKLGDFKNGIAYYSDNGLYGFVTKNGSVHKAEFEWISDFTASGTALIRYKNKYGLVNSAGKIILETAYDQILKTGTEVFVVVSENQYGFFSAAGCFISPVAYDFLKEKPAEYYTNGTLFRLQKKNEVGLADANGRPLISFGQYEDIGFPSDGLIRVRQKNKSGYLESKRLSVFIPLRYSEASDFRDSIAIVKMKDQFALLNIHGVEVYSGKDPLVKISKHIYFAEDEPGTVINDQGVRLESGVESCKALPSGKVQLNFKSGEIKLINE